MLKELLQLWKKSGIMLKAIETFGSMLEDCAYIFERSWKVFSGELSMADEKSDIYNRDKGVNQKERDIRRMLLEHLTMNPGQDASGCLALMSMVKDAERIGDYSKNIFDLTIIVDGNIGKLRYMDHIVAIQQKVNESLSQLKSAFLDSDEQKAQKILADYKDAKDACKDILRSLFCENIPKQEALITLLLARYLKRINSHASNVASGIIYPLDKIDFVRGGLLE
jgi:phosphate uptake regulator